PGARLLRHADAAPRRSRRRLRRHAPRPRHPRPRRHHIDERGRLMAATARRTDAQADGRTDGLLGRGPGPKVETRSAKRSTRFSDLIKKVLIYLVMLVVMALILFPIYWMVTISLKLPREIYRLPSLWVDNPTLDNYRTLIDKKHFLTNIRNSLI